MKSRVPLLLLFCGVVVLVYSIVVLGVVAAAPDLRIRCLLSDSPWPNGVTEGVVMRAVPDEQEVHGQGPRVGDRLVNIGGSRVESFVDFSRALMRLTSQPTPPAGSLQVGQDPNEVEGLTELAQYDNGTRIVEIEFIPYGETLRKKCYVDIQSLPISEVLFSLCWFLLQTVALAIGAAVYWNRP